MPVSSVLTADFGSVHTRVVLIDVVDGVYRLVARGESRTTDGFPANDLAIGLDRVLRQLTEATGRRFTSENGQIIMPEQPDRAGVDTFVVTSSVGRPLRSLVVGLMPDVSIASALRAAAGTYIETSAILSLTDGRNEQERLNAVLLGFPDVIFIVGGTEDGAQSSLMQIIRTVRLAVSLMEQFRRPIIIYAGNGVLAEAIQNQFEDITDVFIAGNVRPSLEDENLESARNQLAQAFDRYAETRSASFTGISAMSTSGVLPTPQSYNLVVDYLGQTRSGGIAAVDVGSAASILAVSLNGRINTTIRTDLGLGHNAPALLEAVSLEAVKSWLPFNVADNDLQNYVANKALRPATIPETVQDLHIEHALLKAGIQTMIEAARPAWNVGYGPLPLAQIIGAGAALTGTGSPGYNALLLLDALQPAGITTLYADPYGLIAGLGAIAFDNPDAVVQILDGDNLENLGTAISPIGKPRLGKTAINIQITLESGEKIDYGVLAGQLWVYDLPAGQSASVRIRCSAGVTLNGKRRVKLTLSGGSAGLIFDARGRPLSLPKDARGRADQIPMWISAMTGDTRIDIDEKLLEAVQIELPPTRSPKRAPKPARSRHGRKNQPASADDLLPGDDDFLELLEDDQPSIDELRRGL